MFKFWIYIKATCLVLFYAFLGAIGLFSVIPLLGYYVWVPLMDCLLASKSNSTILDIKDTFTEKYVFCFFMSLGLTAFAAFAIGAFITSIGCVAQDMFRRKENEKE